MSGLTTSQTADLARLSRDIHAHPELAYHERHAVEAIATLLEAAGHRVERGVGGLETAFRARTGPKDAHAVALIAEYDALPDIGHGCGHNLIAISNVGAFLLAAMRDVAVFPRWLPRFSLVVAALQLFNLSAIWVGIPDVLTLVGNLFFGVWFVAASVGLGRPAAGPARVVMAQPA